MTDHRHGIVDAKHTTDLDRLRHFKHCARDERRERWIKKRIERVKEAKREAAKSWCAPASLAYAGSCWVIPASIVECESHGSWSAYNPSGAVGPYQLLGHGAPFPVTTRDQAMEHHRIAHDLWAGGAGRSNWVC